METVDTQQELVLKGIAASPGIAVGPVFFFEKDAPTIEERSVAREDVEREIARLNQALARSGKELRKILEYAQKRLGEHQAKIFEAQVLILEDSFLFDTILKRIQTECKNVEYVVHNEIEKYRLVMLGANDEYTRERAHDVEDVRNRILRNLQEQKLISKLEGSAVVVSYNLTAADTMILSRNEVLAYATDAGGVTSHTALLARALKIPAVLGLREITSAVRNGDVVIVDGYSGAVIIRPSDKTVKEYVARRAHFEQFEQQLSGLRDLPAETTDGRHVELSANVEFIQELDFIRMQGADGIGLYRSEILLIGKEVFPSEDEQLQNYKHIADAMFPKRVTIRTFDIGGDKMMVQKVKERNPFLGWRGIRVLLEKRDLFLEQLRAILRASTRRNIAVLFPMVSNLKEVRAAKEILEQAKSQLRDEKIEFDDKITVGAMIEVPAAAVIMDDLAQEVDFISIGTNDLIQYLLAVDRGNEFVSSLYQEFHPAVVRFIRRIIERAKSHDIWVGMCGEMAGDPMATVLLLGLGLDEFSVVGTSLPEIKKIIRSTSYEEAQRIAQRVLEFETEDEIKSYLRSMMKEKFPDIPIE
ncbi:MAG: phosphoenolpyruvate--protein phosphotransferase [Ignavibacteriae bacterium]|nr:phosphoenolpyruvate--protein phosphotransferase [Ignavibacteriota bacterium]